MPDRFLRQTWTIRTISPFATPLLSSSSCDSIQLLEDELTRHVRHCLEIRGLVDEEWSEEGTYVTASWIHLGNVHKSRKRTRSGERCSRHLHLDIYVQEAPVAQIICCFAQPNSEKDEIEQESAVAISSFSFLLSRGQPTACGAIYSWLESNGACAVGIHPYCPSPSHIVSTLSTWTTLNGFFSDQGKNKPLQLVFGAPTQHLDKISFSIPPLALTRLCREMERLQQTKKRKKCTTDGDFTDGLVESSLEHAEETDKKSSPDMKGQAKAAGAEPQSSSDDDGSRSNKAQPENTPVGEFNDSSCVLKSIQRFAWEAFHINIESFPMIRASSAVAVLGCNGRCRFLDAAHLGFLLAEIESMIQNQVLVGELPNDGNDQDEETEQDNAAEEGEVAAT